MAVKPFLKDPPQISTASERFQGTPGLRDDPVQRRDVHQPPLQRPLLRRLGRLGEVAGAFKRAFKVDIRSVWALWGLLRVLGFGAGLL